MAEKPPKPVMRARRLHRAAGGLAVLCFLATGAYMRFLLDKSGLTPAEHLCYRSRHIYILAIGLTNLVLGLHVAPATRPISRRAQGLGSALLLAAIPLALAAFAVDPKTVALRSPFSSFALYFLFAGASFHALGVALDERGL